jgi:pyruvate,water dikinase
VGLRPQREWENLRTLTEADRKDVLFRIRQKLAAFSWPAQWSADLNEALAKVQPGRIPSWAIRSSATNEDAGDASAAGVYRTEIGVVTTDVAQAVARCWASLWEERAVNYYVQRSAKALAPALAVIVQPMIGARVAGVAFSRHPITGREEEVLINAVPGLAEPLVSGRVAPDEYVVTRNSGGYRQVTRQHLSPKPFSMSVAHDGTVLERPAAHEKHRSSLTDEEVVLLAASVHRIEEVWGMPVDVEWAFDSDHLWFLQARPISRRIDQDRLMDRQCDWSRANFKETLPDLPSPLGLSFLEAFMEDFILRHYRELGCVVPEGWAAVRIIDGRPFINVTLLQSFLAQLGGHPELVTEQMGGECRRFASRSQRLPAWTLIRGYFVMHRKIRRALRRAPAWFEELKRTARVQLEEPLSTLPPTEIVRRVEWLGDRLRRGECTFAIVAAVGQAQQMFRLWLPRWLGPDWRALLNAALQGRETIISARQVRWLRQVGERARRETPAAAFFLSEPWQPGLYRNRLAGTDCLAELDAFLTEYGHRAIGESDVMTPRFAEDPSYLLEVIRRHVVAASAETAEQAALRQRQDRSTALDEIRRRCGWRYDRWLIFRWWYGRLCRASELREANRHHVMHYAAATRRLAMELGRRLAAQGRLSDPDDVFFVTTDQLKELASGPPARDWKTLVAERRTMHQTRAGKTVPDFVPGSDRRSMASEGSVNGDRLLRGIPIGAGVVEGRVAVVRGKEDIGKVQQGDIIVTTVIDPGMVSLFGLAGGLIADMGGTLSHGAIIIREYGIPAIVNVVHATSVLKDGERVKLIATEGLVHRCSA